MSFTCSLEFKTQVVQLTIVLIFADSAQSRLAAFRNREIQNKCRLLFQTLCFPRINWSFASTWLKLDIFKNRMILYKIAAMPLPTKRFLTTNESLSMKHFIFSSMGIRMANGQSCKLPNLLNEKAVFRNFQVTRCFLRFRGSSNFQ